MIGDTEHRRMPRSYVGVPILERRRGASAWSRSTSDERENAFGESDVRLLQTLAQA